MFDEVLKSINRPLAASPDWLQIVTKHSDLFLQYPRLGMSVFRATVHLEIHIGVQKVVLQTV